MPYTIKSNGFGDEDTRNQKTIFILALITNVCMIYVLMGSQEALACPSVKMKGPRMNAGYIIIGSGIAINLPGGGGGGGWGSSQWGLGKGEGGKMMTGLIDKQWVILS